MHFRTSELSSWALLEESLDIRIISRVIIQDKILDYRSRLCSGTVRSRLCSTIGGLRLTRKKRNVLQKASL